MYESAVAAVTGRLTGRETRGGIVAMRLDCNYPIGDVDPLIHSSATPKAFRSLPRDTYTKARRRSLQHVDTHPPLLRAFVCINVWYIRRVHICIYIPPNW